MDFQQPQASFIPKKPLTASAVAGPGAPSLLWIAAVFLFAVSVLAAVGVFGYTFYLNHQINSAKDSLARAQAAYDPASIEDLIRLNARINHAKELLQSHVAPSALFSFLEANTLSTVRFTQFEYDANPDGSLVMKLTGNALDFASVALQSDQFGAAVHVLKNVIFSGINIDPTTGIVSFDVSANISPDVVSYADQLGGASSASQSAAPASDAGAAASTSPSAGSGSGQAAN